jgi:hypothetical protein
MLFAFVLLVGLVGAAVYAGLVLAMVPGAKEERLGALEELPRDLGVWTVDTSSFAAEEARADGLVRETRICHEPGSGLFQRERLIRQVRYRHAVTAAIKRVEPDEIVRRKRVSR